MNFRDFPVHFDVRTDPVFWQRIRPFIEDELDRLKDFDEKRAAWVKQNLPPAYSMTYVFHEHARRVSEDMRKTALHIGLPQHTAEALYWAMLPHDIGKHTLPVHIWDMMEKPDDGVKLMRRSHTEKGVQIVNNVLEPGHPFIDLMLDIMLNHHEQMDGGGFRGLRGGALSAPVRLACIVESFDGYSIERPHFGDRDISVEGVLKRMREEKGAAHYDMELFEAFAEMKIKERNHE